MSENFDIRIGYWLKLLSRKMGVLQDLRLSKYNITASQLGVLLEINSNDGASQKEIQQNLVITPASFTGLVSSLEGKGYLKRVQDKQDARINRLYITEAGKEMKEKAFEEFLNTKEILVEGFSLEEQVLLVSWLKKMYRNLEKHRGD